MGDSVEDAVVAVEVATEEDMEEGDPGQGPGAGLPEDQGAGLPPLGDPGPLPPGGPGLPPPVTPRVLIAPGLGKLLHSITLFPSYD